LTSDPQVEKGKASVVETPNGAMVFYPGTGGSQSNIYYTVYGNGGTGTAGFGPSIVLPFSNAFKWTSSPSGAARVYNGVGEPGLPNGSDIVELTFIGQLEGKAIPETFYGRMKVDPSALVIVDDNGVAATNPASDGNLFMDLSPISGELLSSAGQPGLFRSLGVLWDRNAPIQLTQVLNGITTNLLANGTAVYDQESGLITYDSNLGGKVYIDPKLGIVRFGSSAPTSNAAILISYTPRFLRISTGSGQGYARATGLYDAREISSALYWFLAGGQNANLTESILNDRMVFTYDQASGGTSQAPRPYVSTLRFGIQLPTGIATTSVGAPQFVTVSGAKGPYQIDPSNGRIYFTDADEDNKVQVNYTGLLTSGTTGPVSATGTVSWVREELEQPILIDNAVNESDLTSFLDPFSFIGQRRPPLIWLFWTSTRTGVSDIYFETIAPQWNPVGISQ
jgi:hypothetical protein